MITLMSLAVLALFTIIAYWKDEKYLLIITGFGILIFGLYYVATVIYLGIIIAIFGIYTGARGLGFRN